MAKKEFYETDEFLALQKEWYAKLGDEILKEESDTVLHPQIFKTEKTQYDGGTRYFELCHTILREYKFKKDLHKIIFGKHTEGLSLRQIQEWLKKTHAITFTFKAIDLLIKRIQKSFVEGTTTL